MLIPIAPPPDQVICPTTEFLQGSGMVRISSLPLELPDMTFFVNVTCMLLLFFCLFFFLCVQLILLFTFNFFFLDCDSANFGVVASIDFRDGIAANVTDTNSTSDAVVPPQPFRIAGLTFPPISVVCFHYFFFISISIEQTRKISFTFVLCLFV